MHSAIRRLARIADKISNPRYRAVFFKNGKVVATDTHVLVELEGKPEDDAVVPSEAIINTEFRDEEPFLAQLDARSKEELPKYEEMFNNEPQTEMVLNTAFLASVFNALDVGESKEVILKIPTNKDKPLVIERADKKGRALVMGIKAVRK